VFRPRRFSFAGLQLLLVLFPTHKPTRDVPVVGGRLRQQFPLPFQSPLAASLVRRVAARLTDRRRLSTNVTVPRRPIAARSLRRRRLATACQVGVAALRRLGGSDDANFLRLRVLRPRRLVLDLGRTVSADEVNKLAIYAVQILA